MNILITGSGGMVGKNLVDRLLNLKQHKVCPTYYEITIPKTDYVAVSEITNKFKFLDIMNSESVDEIFSEFQPEIIIHLAAQSRPDISLRRPTDTFKTNVFGTINLANSSWVKKNLPWIINFSSSAVYGDIDWTSPATENSPTKPITSYGASKLSAERYLHSSYKGITTSLRLFNCSGPYKTSDLISDISMRLNKFGINSLRIGALNKKRHFLHVSDAIEVVLKLIELKKNRRLIFNREFNIAPTHKELTYVSEVIYEFEKILNKKIDLVHMESLMRIKDEEVIWGDSSLISNLLEWQSQKKLNDIVLDSYNYAKRIWS